MVYLQQCRIVLLDNCKLAIAGRSVQEEDAICIFPGTDTACALRQNQKGHWTLISGDCFVFDTIYTVLGMSESDDYLAQHQEELEEFRIR